MKCRVGGCDRDANQYPKLQLCQKHYFRVWRNGTTDIKQPTARGGKYRYQDARGYFFLKKPNHPLADSTGCVWEHRYVYHKHNPNIDSCEICGKELSWETVHIDHIDNDPTNNSLDNLRPLCIACNTFRDRPLTSGCKHIFTIDGVSMSAHSWAARDDVKVSGHTIIRRRRNHGWSDRDCVYKERQTHHNTKTKVLERKYHEMRVAADRN